VETAINLLIVTNLLRRIIPSSNWIIESNVLKKKRPKGGRGEGEESYGLCRLWITQNKHFGVAYCWKPTTNTRVCHNMQQEAGHRDIRRSLAATLWSSKAPAHERALRCCRHKDSRSVCIWMQWWTENILQVFKTRGTANNCSKNACHIRRNVMYRSQRNTNHYSTMIATTQAHKHTKTK
jgi:hypothetical protein